MHPSGPPMRRPGTAPSVWPGARRGGTCVRSEKGLFVVVIGVGVAVLLGDSPPARPPYPTAKASTAAPQHSVIAALPL